MEKTIITIVTHGQVAHADEIVAVAAYITANPPTDTYEYKIIRTRDKDIIRNADVVIDVGKEYDPQRLRFDHHQGDVGQRENGGTRFASAGLIWNSYDRHVINEVIAPGTLTEEQLRSIETKVDKEFIEAIDQVDLGVSPVRPSGQSFSNVLSMFNAFPGEDSDTQFMKAVEFAKDFLSRLIRRFAEEEIDCGRIGKYDTNEQILILPEFMRWKEYVKRHPHIKRVVHFDKKTPQWVATSVSHPDDPFKNTYPFPAAWSCLSDEALEVASGVKGATFCHEKCFMVAADNRESIIQLALHGLN